MRTARWLTVLTAALLACSQASSAMVPPGAKQGRIPDGYNGRVGGQVGCIIYEDAGLRGRAWPVQRGADIRYVGAEWNDRISSVSCRQGCAIIGFEHADYAGASTRFTGVVENVGRFWNDRISALRVRCEGRVGGRGVGYGPGVQAVACTAYEHANYQGRNEEFSDGDEIPVVRPLLNDQISSIQCRPGCEVDVWVDTGFGGEAGHFGGNTAFVGPGWNDRISSLVASCR